MLPRAIPEATVRKQEIDLFRFVSRATAAEILAVLPDLPVEAVTPKPGRGRKCSRIPWDTLVRLNAVLAPERPLAPGPSYRQDRRKRVAVLAQRYRSGYALWHPEDIVYLDAASYVGEQLYRVIYRLADYKRAGCPAEDVDSAPLANGSEAVGNCHLRGADPGHVAGSVPGPQRRGA